MITLQSVVERLATPLTHTLFPLQVIHCVMFPRLEYDLPILSFDMVGKGGGAISLAVIDPCPVSLNRSLPPQYNTTVRRVVVSSHGNQDFHTLVGSCRGSTT